MDLLPRAPPGEGCWFWSFAWSTYTACVNNEKLQGWEWKSVATKKWWPLIWRESGWEKQLNSKIQTPNQGLEGPPNSAHCLSHQIHHSPVFMLNLLRAQWPACCFPNVSNSDLPQDLCTFCSPWNTPPWDLHRASSLTLLRPLLSLLPSGEAVPLIW